LFTNRRRTTAKVLHFDGTGMCLYQKRLEQGQFAPLWEGSEDRCLRLSRAELELFLKGSQLIGKVRLLPSPMDEKALAIGAR
jgi:transposase